MYYKYVRTARAHVDIGTPIGIIRTKSRAAIATAELYNYCKSRSSLISIINTHILWRVHLCHNRILHSLLLYTCRFCVRSPSSMIIARVRPGRKRERERETFLTGYVFHRDVAVIISVKTRGGVISYTRRFYRRRDNHGH